MQAETLLEREDEVSVAAEAEAFLAQHNKEQAEKARYNDATTWFSEALDGNLHTKFLFHYNGKELLSEDGRPMGKVFDDAITDAEAIAAANPTFGFVELRRRRLEKGEYNQMLAMAAGKAPNTMLVDSDFPPELMNAKKDVGGYNVKRKPTFLRVITYDKATQTIAVDTQSLDRSDRIGLEATYAVTGHQPQQGELLGQRRQLDLSKEEQATIMERQRSAYDVSLEQRFGGGSWYAGREPASRRNTYDFVCQQHDLIDFYLQKTNQPMVNESHIRRQVIATLDRRWQGKCPLVNRQSRFGLTIEMECALREADAKGTQYSACGDTSEVEESGYGNKIKLECVTCPSCKTVVNAFLTQEKDPTTGKTTTHINCPNPKCRASAPIDNL